jgi:endothelin-converting enzyme/putative endopeptidase
LAEAYVSSIDGAAIKDRATQYSVLIRDTFAKELETLTWLDQATLNEAKAKLALLGMKIGAPEKFRNYDALKISKSSFFENDQNIATFETRRDLAKLGKPFDKTEWGMMPWEVNAYYDPPNNEFVFPFGILQPPSFDIHANDAVNLGSFGGGTVGHELTHGFDHDGHQYDGMGNIRNWWTPSVSEKFDQKNECYVQQSNQYKVADVDMFVNGKLTLTEVVADNGGVKLGYLALQALRSNRPEAAAWLGKYTENQQFWIGYAQSWCTKRTAESLRNLITSNEHAPEEFRVNGVMMNMETFAKDFGCAVGAPMAPVDHCSLW